jgi:ligand-binding sensor domain-containing protein
LSRLNVRTPRDATALALHRGTLMVGTSTQGTALVSTELRSSTVWLRRRELVGAAKAMSVACLSKLDCYLATGDDFLWHYDGDGFYRADKVEQSRALAIASLAGKLTLLRSSPGEPSVIEFWQRGELEFERIDGLHLATTGPALVRFVRTAPDGKLWVGLWRETDAGLVGGDVWIVDMEAGVAARLEVLSEPVADVAFSAGGGQTAWLATEAGVARYTSASISGVAEVFAEESRSARAVAVSGERVYVATGRGVSLFDGTTWQMPRRLRGSINDVAVGKAGELWIATSRGLGVYNGKRLRRLDVRWGLLENQILDVEPDRFGRMWLRGPQSIGVLTRPE